MSTSQEKDRSQHCEEEAQLSKPGRSTCGGHVPCPAFLYNMPEKGKAKARALVATLRSIKNISNDGMED